MKKLDSAKKVDKGVHSSSTQKILSSHTTQAERPASRERIDDAETTVGSPSALRQALLSLKTEYEKKYDEHYKKNSYIRGLMVLFRNPERVSEIDFLISLAKKKDCPDEVLLQAVQLVHDKIQLKERTEDEISMLDEILNTLLQDETEIEQEGLEAYLENHKKEHPMPEELESFYKNWNPNQRHGL
ncbi:hypothetical protein [Legionella bozemanae]|uniref:hypothetical protein n=1 Tax=Legionella bozemanae TaxID=447 RepID=UPI00399D0A96